MRRVFLATGYLCAAAIPAIGWVGGVGMTSHEAAIYDAAIYDAVYYAPTPTAAVYLARNYAPSRPAAKRRNYPAECQWNYYLQTLSQCGHKHAALHSASGGGVSLHKPQRVAAVTK
jgi:hypothetical protein